MNPAKQHKKLVKLATKAENCTSRKQAKEIMDRVQLTKRIHERVAISFRIVKERHYFLYEDDILSLISPEEWDKKESSITVKQLGDGTWEEVIETHKNLDENQEMS